MKKKLFFFSIKHPLLYILLFAIIVRGLAIIFTDGLATESNFNYLMIPDSWLENHWIVCGSRLILGAFSLSIITLAYRITKIIADKTTALEIAVFGALLWGAPYVSVHAFPGVVATPFMLYGTLLILKQHNLLKNNDIEKFHHTTFIIAGFCLGLGFAVYYQSVVYYIGILATLLILRNWKGALMTLTGYVIAVGITQTFVDILIFHRPFAAITTFFRDLLIVDINFLRSTCFLLVLLLPPVSVLLFFGFFRVLRKYMILVLPTLTALLFSATTYDNFDILLMIMPTYIIAGYVGWKEFYKNSAFWTRNKWLVTTCYMFFALLDILMMILSFIYF